MQTQTHLSIRVEIDNYDQKDSCPVPPPHPKGFTTQQTDASFAVPAEGPEMSAMCTHGSEAWDYFI